MERLELKEIVGYLPYKLQMTRNGFVGELLCIYTDKIFKVSCSNWHESLEDDNFYKPILHPLSDLTKEIEVDGVKFVPINKLLEDYNFDISKMDEEEILSYSESLVEIDMSLMTANRLYEWHFDIHNLINRGLAIDINTL